MRKIFLLVIFVAQANAGVLQCKVGDSLKALTITEDSPRVALATIEFLGASFVTKSSAQSISGGCFETWKKTFVGPSVEIALSATYGRANTRCAGRQDEYHGTYKPDSGAGQAIVCQYEWVAGDGP